MAINVPTYSADKEAGKVSVINVGGAAFYSRKAYSTEDGTLQPELSPLKLSEIDAAIAIKQQELAELNAMRFDIQAALG